jgi:hypothetical protein
METRGRSIDGAVQRSGMGHDDSLWGKNSQTWWQEPGGQSLLALMRRLTRTYCCSVRTYSAIRRNCWIVVALGQPIFRSSISRSKICPYTGIAESP